MYKGYKIRIYPNKEQEKLLLEHIGAYRFIWNYMLNYQLENYANGGKYLSYYSMSNLLTELKKKEDLNWLDKISVTTLRHSCKDLDAAFQRFFTKISNFPKYKSKKKSKKSFSLREDRMWFDEKTVKIEKVGRIKYKTDFDLPLGTKQKFIDARIANINGKWILSFSMECESQAPKLNDFSIGIDLGVKDLATVAFKDEKLVFHNINKSKRMRQLKHLQRSISRKYEANKQGSDYVKTKNIMKQEDKLRKIYARISNIKLNYLHQTTHKIVSMLPARIVMEDLDVRGTMKDKHMSKAIQEQCFYEFRRQIAYKCAWNGIEFVLADRYFPSSKNCSCCGSYKKDLKLKDRTYICNECGLVIDRDYNAALNLMKYMV